MRLTFAKRIVCDPAILGGKPIIKGTRISVEFILGLLESDLSFDEIIREYPHLTRVDIRAAVGFGRGRVAREEILPFELVKTRS